MYKPDSATGWLLLVLGLAALGAFGGAALWSQRQNQSRSVLRYVRGSIGAALIFCVPLGIGGLRGQVEPWAIVQWIAAVNFGALLGAIVGLARAFVPFEQADTDHSGALEPKEHNRQTKEALARIIWSAAKGALIVAAAALVYARPELQLLVWVAAGVALSLPLAVFLLHRTETRTGNDEDGPLLKAALKPRNVPLAGGTLGGVFALTLIIGGPDDVQAGLRYWPIALGAAATLVPLLYRRLSWIRKQLRALRQLDLPALLRISADLVKQASKPARPAWPSMFVALMTGTGLGALLVPDPVVRSTGTIVLLAAILEGVSLGPRRAQATLRGAAPKAAHSEETPLMRGVLHVALTIVQVALTVNLLRSAEVPGQVVIFMIAAAAFPAVSALFHRYPWPERARGIWQRLDHSMIFVMVFATLQAIATTTKLSQTVVWVALVITVAGIVAKLTWAKAPEWLSGSLYAVLGWVGGLIVAIDLGRQIGWAPTLYLLAGGIAYTVGQVFYALGPRYPNNRLLNWSPRVFASHEVMHLMTIVGVLFHWWAIYLLIPV
jgi:hemolysin III